jgi:hypothetical protein
MTHSRAPMQSLWEERRRHPAGLSLEQAAGAAMGYR